MAVGKGGNLSQLSHGVTGRYGISGSIPDTQQDADLRFWIAKHCSLLLRKQIRQYFDRRVCGVSRNIGGFTYDAALPAFV